METDPSQTTMWVVRCPKNHHVAWNGTKYWCEQCSAEYGMDKIVMTPVEKREKSSVRPTVYGRPN